MKIIYQMKKIRILRIIHTLNPELGGPSNAIIHNSIALKKNGFSVDILTSDKSNFNYNKNIKVYNIGPGIGNYGINFKIVFWLLKNKKKYDIFIIHELWRFYNLLARIMLKNYYVFTHGQLDPFFKKNLFKRIKKQIYWLLFEKKNLLKSKSILLTTDEERKLLYKTFVNTDGINKNVVGYGIFKSNFSKIKAKTSFFKRFPYLKKKNFLIFLGRFHEKKGCDILIYSVKKVVKKNIKINILMVGPNNELKKKLQNLCKSLNIEKNFFWSDMLVGKEKFGAIYASKGMVLASHGENFGLSIAESLSCSTPVITTNKVNIFKHILKSKAGLISKNNVNDFSKNLEKFCKFDKRKLSQLSSNSKLCFEKNFDFSKINNGLAKLLYKK
tara:strand:- start:1330 stop:2484 length:1155 start_codon:yes stop_codon:yes gene_type:complete